MSDLKCKFCETPIQPKDRIGDTIVCPNCASYYLSTKKSDQKKKKVRRIVIFGGVVFVALILSYRFGLLEASESQLTESLASMDYSSVASKRQECLRLGDSKCLLLVYHRLIQLDANDVAASANYAFLLTQQKRYQEAEPFYEKIIKEGQGTYDLMAFYAMNLEGLGRTAEAVGWYEKSLSVNSRMVDVVQKLALALVKEKRITEAVSILEGFVQKYPVAEGALHGNIISIKSQIREQAQGVKEKLHLMTLKGSHYNFPIFPPHGKGLPISFLMDTGADYLVMKTEDMNFFFGGKIEKSQKIKMKLASGKIENAELVTIPELRLGPWTLRNIEAIYCDICSRLAGRSILKRLSLKTTPKNEMEYLELSLNR